MPREFSRSDRLGSQIQKDMAELIQAGIRDPVFGLITVSAVEVSRDLSLAKIYVSFLGAQLPPREGIKRLAAHLPELRHELGRRLRIRVLPELRFVHDDSLERGQRLDALLNQLAHEAPGSGEEEPPA